MGIAPAAAVTMDQVRLMADLTATSPCSPDFAATLSHEIRTPLNSIAGYSEMLADTALETRGSLEREDVTGGIERSVRDLMVWVSIALAFVRSKADASVPASYPHDTSGPR